LSALGRHVAATALISAAASACGDPTVVIGARACPATTSDAASAGDAGVSPNLDASVAVPWSTGFEDGFCDYAWPMGLCYTAAGGSYSLVTSPVHSGRYAAAFKVQVTADAGASQARCYLQGAFPSAAYYGAWYYVPATAQNSGVWNLFHYQGTTGATPGKWDVSLVNLPDGGPLHIVFFDFLTGTAQDSHLVPQIPIAQWFHLEVYFKRAKDTSGVLSVLQDGVMAFPPLTGLVTDDTDFGQWYVGNFASALAPPGSTVYVDDVTIGSTP